MRKLKGKIVSNKMAKTVVVLVERLKRHPKYHKYYRVSKRFKAHVESGDYKPGDTVIILEIKPISREKRWKVVELVSSAPSEKSGVKTASAEDTGETEETAEVEENSL